MEVVTKKSRGLYFVSPLVDAARVWLTVGPTAFVGVILSAVQVHHFFVDGVIWKLKTPTGSSTRMVNFSELWGVSGATR